MGIMNMAEQIHIVPILKSTQKTGSDYVAPHINMKLYEKVEFLVMLTAADTAGYTMTVTQSAVTAGSTSTAIAARYRLTAAAGTDTMGAVTALTSSGKAIATGDAGKTYVVDVDSSDLTTDSKPYVGLTFEHSGSADITPVIVALCWPKYPTATNASALT